MLGPKLFNSFIDDMIYAMNDVCPLYNYADDNIMSLFHLIWTFWGQTLKKGPMLVWRKSHANKHFQVRIYIILRPKGTISNSYCPGPLLDDELHLITQCRYHLTERTKLYDTAKMHIAEFGDWSNYDKFALSLGSQSAPVLVALGNFLYTCFRKRNTWQVVYMSSK